MEKVILNPKPGWVIGGEREKQTNSEEKGLFMGEKQRFWGGRWDTLVSGSGNKGLG